MGPHLCYVTPTSRPHLAVPGVRQTTTLEQSALLPKNLKPGWRQTPKITIDLEGRPGSWSVPPLSLGVQQLLGHCELPWGLPTLSPLAELERGGFCCLQPKEHSRFSENHDANLSAQKSSLAT